MRLAANADVGFVHGVDQAYYRVHGQNMRTAFNSLGIWARSDWPLTWCWTATARVCRTRSACPTSCTAS